MSRKPETSRRRRSGVAILLGLVVLSTVLVGCERARVGQRCRGSGWAEDGGAWILRCQGGRYRRVLTKAQYVEILRLAAKPPVGEVVRPSTLGGPQLPNTADPSVLVDGGKHYVFSTSTFRRVPVQVVADIDATRPSSDMFTRMVEAMPARAPWASSDEVWAPAVAKFGSRFVMYFAAHRIGATDPNQAQCVGRALAAAPAGPYVAEPAPITCGNDGVNGALDPSVFVAPDGSARLMVAMGGSNVNIWSFPLDGNGSIAGPSVALLAREQPWEDWFLENPSMIFDGRDYLLAYSAGRWQSAAYVTGIARCASPAGPCSARPDGPWLSSIGDRVGPGGLEFFVGADGRPRAAFHTYPADNVTPIGARATHVRGVAFDPWPRLVG